MGLISKYNVIFPTSRGARIKSEIKIFDSFFTQLRSILRIQKLTRIKHINPKKIKDLEVLRSNNWWKIANLRNFDHR